MTSYAKKELARYWPVAAELMAQYRDGLHTEKDRYGQLGWMQNGRLHRDGDLPARIYTDGSLAWYQNGRLHRDGDKPAVISGDSSLAWYQNGQLHRFGGPAEIWLDGEFEWWVNGEVITQVVTDWLAGEEWCGTPEQIVEFQFRFC